MSRECDLLRYPHLTSGLPSSLQLNIYIIYQALLLHDFGRQYNTANITDICRTSNFFKIPGPPFEISDLIPFYFSLS